MSKQTGQENTPTMDSWKAYLRNILQERQQGTAAGSSSSESSFELEESFKTLLARKREEMQKAMAYDEKMVTEAGAGQSRSDVPSLSAGNDSTFLEHDSMSKISDTSFEEMERICAVLDKVNGYGTNIDEQIIEKPVVEKPIVALPTVTLGDLTQLDDIDEPSGLWENTILPGAGGPMVSPVKRVHMLRPSTILEESTFSEAGRSKDSSIETFISAKQTTVEGVELESMSTAVSGSEVYRTAQETFDTDSYARSNFLDMDSGLTSDITSVTDRSYHKGVEETDYSKNSTRSFGAAADEKNVIILDSSESDDGADERQVDHGNETMEDPLATVLTDDDESYVAGALRQDEHDEATFNYTEVSVLDDMPDRFNDTLEETDFMLKQGMKLMALKKQQQEDHERRKDEEPVSYHYRGQHENPFMVKSRHNSDSDEGSRPILHTPSDGKGLTPMGSHSSYLTPSSGGMMRSKLNVSNGSQGTGFRQALFSSAGKKSATKAPASGAVSAGSFKKPVSRLPHLKPVSGRKFDHIVSPIGAYIKKTPQSMLQARINCNNKNLIDVLHSENRDSVMSGIGSKENHTATTVVNLKGYTSSLPGKGVIGSNRAHILDERNAVRIPGGEKMQKLINNSPTMVIRHEGRIKYADDHPRSGQRFGNNSTLGDDSLADLSVLSSDVSVRVLKDAKRYH